MILLGSAYKFVFVLCLAAVATAQPAPDRPPAIGDVAPPLSFDAFLAGVSTPSKGGMAWRDYAGKTVVLEFSATWCAPCIANIPHLNELVGAFADEENVVFIALSNEKREQAEKLVSQHGLETRLGWDADGSTFEAFWVNAIPHAAVIGPDGRIAALTHPSNLTEGLLRRIHAGEPAGLPASTSPPRRRNWNQWGDEAAQTELQDSRTVVEAWLRSEDALGGMTRTNDKDGTIRLDALPAESLFQSAWGVGSGEIEFRVELPAEAYFTLFVDGPDGNLDAARRVARALLEAHFGVEANSQTRRRAALALALVPGAQGPERVEGEPSGGTMMGGRLSFPATRMDPLVTLLSKVLDEHVVDRTGLDSVYEVDIEWDFTSGRAGLEDALRSIGLELIEVEADVRTVVIDRTGEP